MVKKRPQLKLDELQQLKWALGSALAVLSAWTVLYLEIDAGFWVLAVTLAALVVLVWPTLPARIPAVLHRFAFPAIVAVFAYDLYETRQPLPSMVKLELMLLFYRLVSYRRRRDDLQLIVLGLFLVVVTGVLTVSPLFVVQLLAFTACALAFLFLTTLVDAAQSETGSGSPAVSQLALPKGGVPSWADDVRWMTLLRRLQATVDWRLLVLGGFLFGGVVAVSGMLFMAIPRFEIGSSFFLDRMIKKQTRTGFSENVRFGDVTSIQEDDGIAMSVDVSDPNLLPGVPYWRMVVLDEYRDGGFRMSMELTGALAEKRPQARTQLLGDRTLRDREEERWSFYFEPGVSRFLPLGGSFYQLTFNRPVALDFSSSLRMLALTTEPVELLGFQIRGLAMSAIVPDPEFAAREQGRTVSSRRVPDYRRILLEEEETARLKEMVAEFTGGAQLSAEEFARRACLWLSERHTYSMQSQLVTGPTDPLIRWLDSRGPGHCEFFAGAFAHLASAAGYPVRMVVGFKGGSWNAFSNSLIVRHSHAHAWCELWNGRDAWVRVDPTPGSTATVGEPTREVAAAEMRGRPVDSDWNARLDSLRVFWYRRVVNFDQNAQVEMASGAKRGFDALFARLRAVAKTGFEHGKQWLDQPWNSRRSLAIFVPIVGGTLALWWLVTLARKWGWRAFAGWGLRDRGDPVRREASRWLLKIRAGEPPAGSDRDRLAVRRELERLRFGPRVQGGAAVIVFTRARRVVARSRRR